jgi:hypothetical protein
VGGGWSQCMPGRDNKEENLSPSWEINLGYPVHGRLNYPGYAFPVSPVSVKHPTNLTRRVWLVYAKSYRTETPNWRSHSYLYI